MKQPAPGSPLTSLTLAVDAERLQLDVVIPITELGVLLNGVFPR